MYMCDYYSSVVWKAFDLRGYLMLGLTTTMPFPLSLASMALCQQNRLQVASLLLNRTQPKWLKVMLCISYSHPRSFSWYGLKPLHIIYINIELITKVIIIIECQLFWLNPYIPYSALISWIAVYTVFLSRYHFHVRMAIWACKIFVESFSRMPLNPRKQRKLCSAKLRCHTVVGLCM